MTFFDFIVPVVALVIGAGGVALARAQAKALDRKTAPRHHPAE